MRILSSTEVKKLYLLLRAVDSKSAEERLHKEQHGANFLSFISEKLSPVPGTSLVWTWNKRLDQIWNEVDAVINFAATTNFDERYDVALGINTMGALHLLNFVKKSYVCGEDGGLIKEKPFRLGTAKKSTKVTDIGMEKKLVEEKLRNLHSEHAEESVVTTYMKDYGIKRARMHGWPNTYVFTKAMGEMLLVHHNRDTVPLVILRPTMVTSTYQEPFPGWIEGVRTIDGVAVGYAKGKLKAFPFNPKLTVDVIPADMVINALIMAMVEYANRSTPSEIIYHVGSSLRNPFKFSKFQELGIRYFVQNPLIDKDGKPIKVGKVTTFSSMASFRIYMAIRYSLALKVFHLAINTVLFQKSYKDKYIALERKLKRGMRLADLYEPYVFFKGIFDDANSEKLQIAASKTCQNNASILTPRVIGKALFDVLREQHGANFLSFISEKLSPVPGDISCVDLGIRDSLLKDQIWNEVDAVINFAATTNFDERYDVALGINTMGALHLLNFVKKCNHVKVLGHLSTAYVCGEDGGLIKEKPFRLGTAKKSTKVTDIGMEKKLVEEKLTNLHSEHAEESVVTTYMKDYGIKRARMHGWPNTYVFTKAMGEMLLVHHNRDTVPLVILRPTMVTSTYQEPFPGWLEGVRTIDGVAVGYAKGKLKAFPFNPKLTVDVIPADMVINALIMAMVEYANQSTPSEIIYHVGSSLRNPFKFSNFTELIHRYFAQNPLIDKDGKPIKVGKLTAFSSMAIFRIYMAIRYSLALKVFHLAISTVLFQKSWKDKYIALERNLKRAMRLAELYEPYVFFKGIFDDANSEKLQIADLLRILTSIIGKLT
uniref:Fatty acyl-CoA reductase n=1 Tax=Salix viminalis TaxID=40686 RepID=A0A6N2LR99_SALVM